MKLGVRDLTQRMISDPSESAMYLWVTGTLVGLVAVLAGHWSSQSFRVLIITIGCAGVAAGVRVLWRRRLPRWTLYFDAAIAVGLISLGSAYGSSGPVSFAVLYLLIALNSALYFRPVHAFLMLGFEGVAYAIVLTWGPHVADPVTVWVMIFGTGAILSGVVVTLVGDLNRASREDALTRLPNRRTWDERMDDELERARRGGRPLTVVIFDVDDFKAINDELGHVIGDRVLRHLSARWRAQLRTGGDFIARIGGDEFGLIAPETDANGIVEVDRAPPAGHVDGRDLLLRCRDVGR